MLTEAMAREAMLDCRVTISAHQQLRDRIASDVALLQLVAFSSEENVRQGQVARMFLHVCYFLHCKSGDTSRWIEHLYSTQAVTAEQYERFRSFCLEHRSDFAALLQLPNQDNFPLRAAALYPAFCFAAEIAPGIPLALVEIGPSLGLNLLWDHYRYDFGPLGQWGALDSKCRLPYRFVHAPRAEGHSGASPFPDFSRTPKITRRIGIEKRPVALDDADSILWMRCLSGRGITRLLELFDAALETRRRSRDLLIVEGDAADRISEVLSSVPADEMPCIFHSFVAYQLPDAARARLMAGIKDAGRKRKLIHITLGEAPTPRGPRLDVTCYDCDAGKRDVLGYCDGTVDVGVQMVWVYWR